MSNLQEFISSKPLSKTQQHIVCIKPNGPPRCSDHFTTTQVRNMAKEGVLDDLALLGVDYEFEPEDVDEGFFLPLDEGTNGDSGKDNAPTSSK